MVGLHVLDHEIVGGAAVEARFDVGYPSAAVFFFNGVDNGYGVVDQQIGVVAHSVVQDVLLFEERGIGVVDAYAEYGGRDIPVHLDGLMGFQWRQT